MGTQKWLQLNDVLKGFILSQVREEAFAQDILQETLLKIHLNITQLKDESKLLSWAFRIARNVLIDEVRKRKKEISVENPTAPMILHSSNDAVNSAMARWIPEAIKLLPELYREAIYLTEIEGLTQKELAERLGISYSGAKSRVQRGKEKLKAIILDCCEVQTDKYGNIIDYQKREKKCQKC